MATRYAASLSFLLSQLGAHVAHRFGTELAETGMSPRGFGVLSNVIDLGPRTQQHLADELGIHRNNMVAVIDELERDGLVQRIRNTADRRSFLIQATPDGVRATSRAMNIVTALDAEIAGSIDGDSRETLDRILLELVKSAQLSPGVHPHLTSQRSPQS